MTFRLEGGRPGDERGFIHKKLLGGISKLAGIVPIPGADLVSGLAKTLAGSQEKNLGAQLKLGDALKTTVNIPCLPGGAESLAQCLARRAAAAAGVTPGGGCPSGTIPDPRGGGFCVTPKSPFGRGRGATQAPVGDAVMGQFGAALEPGILIIERAVCLPGMQLGKDRLCYNKGAITNSQRLWPRGRRPLLTGGDMRAISIAGRAGDKLDRTTKRLRALGMMKRLPAPKRLPAHAHAKPAAAVSV